MTRLEALKRGFSLPERTVLDLYWGRTSPPSFPDDPEAFRDGVELRYHLVMLISADSVDVERSIESYNACVDRVNAKYGADTASKYQDGSGGGLNC